jgi:hypothetical protein
VQDGSRKRTKKKKGMLMLQRELSTKHELSGKLIRATHGEVPQEICLKAYEFQEFEGDWKSRKKVGVLGGEEGEEMGTGNTQRWPKIIQYHVETRSNACAC